MGIKSSPVQKDPVWFVASLLPFILQTNKSSSTFCYSTQAKHYKSIQHCSYKRKTPVDYRGKLMALLDSRFAASKTSPIPIYLSIWFPLQCAHRNRIFAVKLHRKHFKNGKISFKKRYFVPSQVTVSHQSVDEDIHLTCLTSQQHLVQNRCTTTQGVSASVLALVLKFLFV